MKRKLIGMAVLTAMILSCMTGCGQKADSSGADNMDNSSVSDVTTADSVSNEGIDISETEPEETFEPNKPNPNGDVDGDDVYMNSVKLVPDGEITHSGVNFGLVSVDGQPEIDIFKLTRTELVEGTPWTVKFRSFKTASYAKFDFPDYSFYSNVYGKGVHLEYLEDDMVLLVDQSEDDRLWEAELKGLEWCILEADHGNWEYNHITFYNDIILGMPKSDVDAVMGEGTIGTDFTVEYRDGAITYHPVIYKSETTTMVIMYEDFDSLTGEPVPVVSRIFVLKNA